MKDIFRVAIGQINCTVGDIEFNKTKMLCYIDKARGRGADLIAFPELAVTGYSPEDLVFNRVFVSRNISAVKEIARSAGGIAAVVGFIDRKGGDLYNAAAVIRDRKIIDVYHKNKLANFGPFHEMRYFKPGAEAPVYRFGAISVGVNICRDIWLSDGPTAAQAKKGAGLIININASPYHSGRPAQRERTVSKQARSNKVCVVYANMVGGQDELVYDGRSIVVDSSGRIVARARAFEEELLFAEIEAPRKGMVKASGRVARPQKDLALTYEALKLGLSDYLKKNGFKKAVLGLSGGIDSSLVAAIAADALGKDNVTGVYMPTRYSSDESANDAKAVASALGVKLLNISIDQIYRMYLLALDARFAGTPRGTAEENIQARIRGTLLMALSNKFGWLVLSTGNKSESATGYATLYGDMAGGFSVIKDVLKTSVYSLARYRNSVSKVFPERVFTKHPTAELRFNQRDQDTLPPYGKLDAVLKDYIEGNKDAREIIKSKKQVALVSRVVGMVDSSEYKRRQAPIGTKISPRAFGRDRLMPVTNHYRPSGTDLS